MCRCVFSLVFGFERGVNVGIKGLGFCFWLGGGAGEEIRLGFVA